MRNRSLISTGKYMNKGLLKAWNDEKGFGFIKSDTLAHDTFIHISALKHMSRKPKVGDIIYFEVATQPDGKTKAVNCRIEGVAALKVTPKKSNHHRVAKSNFTDSFLGKVASISIIAVLGFIAVNKYSHYKSNEQFNNNTPVINYALAADRPTYYMFLRKWFGSVTIHNSAKFWRTFLKKLASQS